MSKPFFFRISAGDLLDFATDPEGESMTLFQFAKELKKGRSDVPFIQSVIDEAHNYIEKKKNAGKSGGKAKASKAKAKSSSAKAVLEQCCSNDLANPSIPLASSSNIKDIRPYSEIIEDLNRKGGFRYQVCEPTKRFINARFSDGYKLEDFYHVHTVKIAEWKGTENAKYLRPETLYGNKFQGYVNQKAQTMKTIQNADGDFIQVPA